MGSVPIRGRLDRPPFPQSARLATTSPHMGTCGGHLALVRSRFGTSVLRWRAEGRDPRYRMIEDKWAAESNAFCGRTRPNGSHIAGLRQRYTRRSAPIVEAEAHLDNQDASLGSEV